MSIAKKLMIAVVMAGAIVLICILIPLITVRELTGVGEELARYERLQNETAQTQELQLQVANVWQFMTDASLTREKEVIEKEAKAAYDKSMQLVSGLLDANKNNTQIAAKLKIIQQELPTMWQTGTRMFVAYGQSFAEGNKAMEDYDKACDQVIKEAAEVAAKSRQDGQTQMKLISRVSIGGGIAAVIGLSVIILMFFVRSAIIRPLKLILDEVSLLARGEG